MGMGAEVIGFQANNLRLDYITYWF